MYQFKDTDNHYVQNICLRFYSFGVLRDIHHRHVEIIADICQY